VRTGIYALSVPQIKDEVKGYTMEHNTAFEMYEKTPESIICVQRCSCGHEIRAYGRGAEDAKALARECMAGHRGAEANAAKPIKYHRRGYSRREMRRIMG